MKLSLWITLHAIVLIAAGIAFAMYGPLMLAFFSVPDILEDQITYWHVAAFGRMFGAALFGLGLLLWALRASQASSPEGTRRSVIASLLISSLVAAIVSLTQQSAIWGTLAGWITSGVFVIFTLGYALLYWQMRRIKPGQDQSY